MRIVYFIWLHLCRFMLGLMLRILSVFVREDPKLIIFVSFNGRAYSDNPRYLFEYMRDNNEFSDYRFVWAFKEAQVVDGAESVKFNSLRYYYLLTKAKYWIFNAKMAPYYHKRDSQVYLQTWHGTPLKRLGHDIVDNGSTYYRSRQSYAQMVKSYDSDGSHWNYLLSPNSFSTQAFSSAFAFPKEKILEVGYPRLDCLVGVDQDKISKIKQQYGLPLDKKVILYAPTWRDDSFTLNGYTFELQVDFERWHSYLSDEYVVLFKPHYLISNGYQVPASLNDFVYTMGASADINDAYLMSDVLVTDYSSVFFDYALLGRPIYFYMYDFDEYKEELRGFYLKVPEELPNGVVKTETELLKKIKENDFDYQRLADFNQKFNLWNDGNVCAKVLGEIFREA
ncbi:CDP-glycerol glycerophosphotransferase [Ligilactobacillus salitolerans]|uniref:CDP-glycerol glycerophosphotransferase n=1 Tax=Ligilactobacillus salitolerans TaxID=1808352 RepID=A0A401ISP5_9LACO|nr:CDP-glycerol glycerophosphotransferase family protein [Ligilactobacillus salitolerans]GBG94546.1 CDP-glycerol glycerophosphotransferase [Ligilactobacillus salitolerans]